MVVREAPPLEQVRRLGAQLLQSREHVNNVVALLRFAAHRDGAVAAEAVTVLQAFFAQLLRSHELLLHPAPANRAGGVSGRAGEERAKEEVYQQWARARYGEYTGALKARLRSAESSAASKRIAVGHLMELARLEKKGGLAGATINKILIPLVEGEAGDPSVLAKFACFFTHADVRRHVYGAVEQLCASMAAAAAKHSTAAQGEADAAAAKRDAMCLNILEVLLAMPMPPAPKPGGKRLLAEVGQGGGEQDDLLSTWALPAPPSGACCLGLGGVPTAPPSPALAVLACHLRSSPCPPPPHCHSAFRSSLPPPLWSAGGAQQRGGKQTAGGKRGRQAGQQGSRKRAAGIKDEGEMEEEGEQREGEAEERRAVVVGEERKALAGAWLGLLALPLPLDAYKKVLGRLHNLIPHLPNPLLLSDFLTASYEQGGACAVAALAALFRLVTEHGLEAPHFYPRLYRLLDSSVFRAAHRAKFFELLDVSLASPLLPAYMAAAFTKQLFRLSLCAPPSGAIVVVALAHNLLRRHPAIVPLVHRNAPPDTLQDSSSDEEDEGEQKHAAQRGQDGQEGQDGRDGDKTEGKEAGNGRGEEGSADGEEGSAEDDGTGRKGTEGKGGGEGGERAAGAGEEGGRGGRRAGRDPFDEDASDLMAARALDSSLWEVEALQRHYCPAVSRFVASLEKDLSERSSTVELNVADFSATSYGTIMADELGRRVKAVPLAFFERTPTTLFPTSSSPCASAIPQSSSFPGWKFF
ncbi:unnamed protein product [Closterium sp. Naga37s-1]|nr:unnamed protein product [Closterium sp. Naga37s-1]